MLLSISLLILLYAPCYESPFLTWSILPDQSLLSREFFHKAAFSTVYESDCARENTLQRATMFPLIQFSWWITTKQDQFCQNVN